MTARVGVGEYFLIQLDSFAAHPERYEQQAYRQAAEAVDTALSETMKYIRDENKGVVPQKTGDQLSDLWQAASRAVNGLNPEFAQACLYKALGWIEPEYWDRAHERDIRTDIESIQGERIKLIKAAKLPVQAVAPAPVILAAEAAGPPSGWKWVTDKEHRERVVYVGGILAALLGGLWTIFVYFDGKTWVMSWFRKDATYYVCVGEHKSECRSDYAWLPCNSDIAAWAKRTYPDACVYVTQKKISDISGNQCGYLTAEVKCSTRK